jgi:hypothetical protein
MSEAEGPPSKRACVEQADAGAPPASAASASTPQCRPHKGPCIAEGVVYGGLVKSIAAFPRRGREVFVTTTRVHPRGGVVLTPAIVRFTEAGFLRVMARGDAYEKEMTTTGLWDIVTCVIEHLVWGYPTEISPASPVQVTRDDDEDAQSVDSDDEPRYTIYSDIACKQLALARPHHAGARSLIEEVWWLDEDPCPAELGAVLSITLQV